MTLRDKATKIEALSMKYFKALKKVRDKKPLVKLPDKISNRKETTTPQERRMILYKVCRGSGIKFEFMLDLLKADTETWDYLMLME